jgi:uncharacterized membrane protein
MTLLILDIHVPHLPDTGGGSGLGPALLQLWPRLAAYIISFVLLGTLWVGQSFQFHWIRRSDRPLLWLSLGFLMCVAFLPFSAALLSEYGASRNAVLVYGGNLLLAGLFLDQGWHHAVRRNLLGRELSPEACRGISRRTRGGFLVYLVSTLLAFADPRLSLLGFIVVPIAYIRPGLVDRHLDVKSD